MRAALRHLRGLVNEAFTRLWSVVFGLLAGRRTTPTASLGEGQPVLVVAPHPDDESAACGGAILLHRLAGDPVTVAWATDGRRSRALGISPEATASARRLEAEKAARRLDIEGRWLGMPEGEWQHEALTRLLGELLEEINPTLVYAPSGVDFHPEHLAVARALAAALDAHGASVTAVRIFSVQVPLTPKLANRVLPVSEVETQIRQALEAYPSQLGALRCTLRRRRYAARNHGASGSAEEFWQLSAASYCALHRNLEVPSQSPFRSLRYDAWSDPLAYWRGVSARRRWAVKALDEEQKP